VIVEEAAAVFQCEARRFAGVCPVSLQTFRISRQPRGSHLVNGYQQSRSATMQHQMRVRGTIPSQPTGTGWPSFWALIDRAVGTTRDMSFSMVPRCINGTAVHFSRCGVGDCGLAQAREQASGAKLALA
jgi:hypothetical protein